MNVKNASQIFTITLLIIAMSASAADTIQNNTARAEGLGELNEWFAVGGSVGGGGPAAAAVLALHRQGDTLYVGGRFSVLAGVSGYSAVAAWDGQAWSNLGAGVEPCCYSEVKAMTTYNGDLIVGGRFDSIGGVTVNNIARWDGQNWHALDGGVSGWNINVWSLGVHQGELIVGGEFSTAGGSTENGNIARWNGSSWSGWGSAPFGPQRWPINGIVSHQGKLFVGGAMQGSSSPGRFVAQWDGQTWTQVGDGFDARVTAMTLYQGSVIAAGAFTQSGTTPTPGIARWNGSSWEAVGDLNVTQALSLGHYNGELLVGGGFSFTGDDAPLSYLARWNGEAWRPLGTGVNGRVYSIEPFQGSAHTGGDWSLTQAGSVTLPHFGRWRLDPIHHGSFE